MAGRYVDVAVKLSVAGTIDGLYVRDGQSVEDAVKEWLAGDSEEAVNDVVGIVEELDAKGVTILDMMELHAGEKTRDLNEQYPDGNPDEDADEEPNGEDEPEEAPEGTGFLR